MFLRSELVVVPTSPALEPQFQENALYLGSLLSHSFELGEIPPSLESWLGRSKCIFIYLSVNSIASSLSEIYHLGDVIFSELGLKLVLSVGNTPELLKMPQYSDRVAFVDYVPGMSIMQHAELVVTRGGPNTILSSLISGKPLLLMPGKHAEPMYFSKRIEEIGAGQIYSHESIMTERMADHLLELYHNSKYTECSKEQGNIVRRLGGSQSLLAYLEEKF